MTDHTPPGCKGGGNPARLRNYTLGVARRQSSSMSRWRTGDSDFAAGGACARTALTLRRRAAQGHNLAKASKDIGALQASRGTGGTGRELSANHTPARHRELQEVKTISSVGFDVCAEPSSRMKLYGQSKFRCSQVDIAGHVATGSTSKAHDSSTPTWNMCFVSELHP